MEEKWQVCTIEQLGVIGRGRSKHRPRNDSILFGGDYPFIQTGDVKHSNLYITEYSETYNDVGLAQSKLWDKGTLCITIAANIAETAILGIDACFPDSVVGFKPFEGVADTKYVKYMMDMFKVYMQQISKGTTQDNLSLDKIRRVKFEVPSYDMQIKIVDILSALDDSIENNIKRIKLLEQMAENLYKEWFVRFRFPGHENAEFEGGKPTSWNIKKISEIVEYIRGISYSSEEIANVTDTYFVNLKNLRDYGGFRKENIKYYSGTYKNEQMLKPYDLVMGITEMVQERRIIGYVGLVPTYDSKCVFTSDLLKLISDYGNFYLYCLFTYGGLSLNIAQKGSGTNVIHLRPDSAMKTRTVIPDIELANVFNDKVAPIFKMIDCIQLENDNLIKQRNLLLPRLMSGKLEVK